MNTDRHPNRTYAIRHRVEIESTPERVFAALSTSAGLAAWWTSDVSAEPEVGTIATMRFGDGNHGPDMRIRELSPNRRVAWRCIDGPWQGMDFTFSIAPHQRGAVLVFCHEGWPDQGDFFMHCNTKWAFFLAVSLKRYLETGTGQPHPNEPSI